jgi:hypothetical protein
MIIRFLYPLAWLIPLMLFSHNSVAQDNPGVADSLAPRFDNMKDFTKKGCRLTGGTLSLKMKNTSDQDQLIRYVEANESYDFAIRADGAYAFADQNFAGLALIYGQTKKSGQYQNGDGEIYSEDFFGNQYSFSPFLKNLTPLDKNGRFSIITQIELWNQIEQGITQTILNETVTRKNSLKYTGLLGVRPGISVFVLQNVAFETTLNIAGVKYSYERIKTTAKPDSKTETADIDFKIDILQLNIGIFVYLRPKKS